MSTGPQPGHRVMHAFCVHYRGSLNVCKAGVQVEDVRDRESRLPCAVIHGITGELACDKLELPANVTEAASAGVMVQMLERMGNGRCPKCDVVITGEMDFNGNTLALPCRHVLKHEHEGS